MFSHGRTSYAVESATGDIELKGLPVRKIECPTQYENAPKKKVLLLDDREDFREVLEEYLISRFYQVTAVPNGVEGLREIMKDPFDLIICDMMMPKLGGEMFYWAVTRMRPAAGLRFLFFTGHQNDPKIQSFFQRINATVLIKPFRLEALNAAILDVSKKLL
jgi:CheY-like chemotaxis protein